MEFSVKLLVTRKRIEYSSSISPFTILSVYSNKINVKLTKNAHLMNLVIAAMKTLYLTKLSGGLQSCLKIASC